MTKPTIRCGGWPRSAMRAAISTHLTLGRYPARQRAGPTQWEGDSG
jgi:hypothetical protein